MNPVMEIIVEHLRQVQRELSTYLSICHPDSQPNLVLDACIPLVARGALGGSVCGAVPPLGINRNQNEKKVLYRVGCHTQPL
jgi:hypothetical protein